MRSRARSTRSSEEGQILPLLATALIAVLAVGFVLFQVGNATQLSTKSQTAGDAAALAGEEEVKLEVKGLTFGSSEGFDSSALDQPRICAAAADYARRNDGELQDCQLDGYDVLVTVRSNKTLGEGAKKVGRADAHATSRARASLDVHLGFSGPAVGGQAGTGGGGGGVQGGANHISDAKLKELEEKAGVKALPNSALRVYGGTGNGDGPDVADLQEPMQVAMLRAEALMHQPIVITSAYRTAAYQAQLCATQGGVGGRCAAAGQSMHNVGLAIDVSNVSALASVAQKAGLCQPFPGAGDDYVHFSFGGDVECGGNTGSLGKGQVYGGNPSSFASFGVRLVPYEGGGSGL